MINSIHCWLGENYQSYRAWHSKSYHHHVHWAGLAIVVVATGLFLTTSIERAYAAVLPSALVMGTDHIPDFSLDSTKTQVTAQKSGSWSDPTVWSGGVLPTSANIVIIPAGQTVTYDTTSGVAYTISVNGTLKFRTDINTKLTVTNLEVMPTGYLEIGTVANPVNSSVNAEVVIADTPIDTTIDPEQWGTGFLSFGKVRINGAMKSPTFLRVATEPMAGQNTITLAQAPTGWQVGDRIFIPDTRHLKQGEVSAGSPFFVLKPQWEEFTIQGISGNVITLSSSLVYNHKGARDVAGNIDFLPHVGNLTRNVTFRSANPSGTRGHMAMIHMADADIRYATFKDMGRTTYDPLVIGINQKGRYALHMHHDMGPMTPTSNGYQFTLIGNAVDGGSSIHKFKWGITVHDSHFGLIQDNVIYNMGGAGIMTEDGNETMNVFDHNFVERVAGTGDNGISRGTEFGYEGAGIWLRGANNIVRNNVVSNFVTNGISYLLIYLGNVRVPNYKGADTTVAGQFTIVSSYAQTIPEFDNNEIYGSGSVGLTHWWLGSEYGTPRATSTSVFKNTKIWHVSDRAVYNYPSSNITYDGLTIRGDSNALQSVSCCGVGYEGGDYFANNITFRNIDIQGMRTGMHISTWAAGTQIIENSYLKNKNDIGFDTMWTSSCDSSWIPPRLTVIKNTKMDLIPGSGGKTIFMNYQPYPVSNVIQKDEVYVVDYNQVAGDNFRVYYTQADPSSIVPQGFYSLQYGAQCVSLMSSPVAGLTNTQTFAQYGFAVGGTPATCSDKSTHPEINGITCPYTSIAKAPLTKTVNPTGLVGGPIGSTGSGTVSTTTTTTSGPAPTITMSASPASVVRGSSSTITWSTTNAASCTASVDWTGTKATSGSQSVTPPDGQAAYVLTCVSSGGVSASKTILIPLVAASSPLATVTISATPTTVTSGSSSAITWSSTNATSCTASGAWSGAKGTSGSVSVSPTANSTYTLTCSGANATPVINSTNIAVTPATNPTDTTAPTITGITKTNITNNSATISWTTNEAANGQVEFTNPCPSTGCMSALVSALSTAHSVTVTGLAPNTMYMFKLRSADAAGNLKVLSSDAVLMFTTLPNPVPPPTVNISVSPSTISSDGNALMTWSTTDATSVVIDSGIGGVQSSGQMNIAPKVTTTYTITAYGTSNVSKSVTVTVTVKPPVVEVTTPTLPTPVAYWKFNSDAGLNVADSSGNGYFGTLMNGVIWSTGHSATSLLFDGVNDYVNIGSNSAFNITGDVTVSAWINAEAPTETGLIVGKGGCWGASCPFNFRIGRAGRICFDQNNGGSGQDTTCTTDPISFGSWKHVAATRTGNTINIYVDGVLSGTRVATRPAANNSGSLQIGSISGDTGSAFKGKIDEVQIFSKALSASEIQSIMNQ